MSDEIIVKKRISLDFLGEDYANSYVVFESLAIEDYKKVQAEVKAVPDGKFMEYVTEFLKNRLISGKLDQEGGQKDITKDNFSRLDIDTMFVCYKALTGQTDPKA